MKAMRFSRKARWAVPGAAVVTTGAVIAGSVITVAQASPALPPKTAAQLLADVASTQKIPALTGTVVETASLGLPALPQAGNPTSLTALITGSHTIKVYWQDGTHYRLAIPQTMSETDLIRNGGTAWLWESSGNTVTEFSLAGHSHSKKLSKVQPELPPLTPQQAANDALAAVGKTSRRTAARRSARSASRSTPRRTSRCASRYSRRGRQDPPSRSPIPRFPTWLPTRRTSPSPRRPARPSTTRPSRRPGIRPGSRPWTAPPVPTGRGG
jgi:hypothetical protein